MLVIMYCTLTSHRGLDTLVTRPSTSMFLKRCTFPLFSPASRQFTSFLKNFVKSLHFIFLLSWGFFWKVPPFYSFVLIFGQVFEKSFHPILSMLLGKISCSPSRAILDVPKRRSFISPIVSKTHYNDWFLIDFYNILNPTGHMDFENRPNGVVGIYMFTWRNLSCKFFQSWALSVFFYLFNNKKWLFAFLSS